MSMVTQSHREDLHLRGPGVLDWIAADPPATRRSYSRIRVALPIPDQASRAYEKRLNRQLRSSGSGTALSTMLLTTLAYVVYLGLSGTSLAGSWRQLALGVALVLAGAALGKVLGLFYWNLLLKRTALRLRALATTSDFPPRTHSTQAEFPPPASVSPGHGS